MHNQSRIPKIYIIALAVIILVEVFVCNYLFYRNLKNDEVYFSLNENDRNVSIEFLTKLSDGGLWVEEGGQPYIEIKNLDIDGRSLYIDLADVVWSGDLDEKSVDFKIEMIDESHNDYFNRGGIKTVSALIEQTKYYSLRPMGHLKAVRINICNVSPGDNIYIAGISLNRKWPMFFSIFRVLLFFFIFVLIYNLRKGSAAYDVYYDNASPKQGVASVFVFLAMLMICLHLAGFLTQGSKIWYANPYDLLAHSIAHGQVDLDVDMPADESLLAVEDPYVPANRVGVSYMWDCAYYQGKYYVYYGVVPEILFYLPHYLLTGKDFGITAVGKIELGFLMAGIYLCFLELGKRFSGQIPYVTWVLLFVASTGGLGVILLSKQILFYHIPVIMGCALLSLGIYFWLSSEKQGGKVFSVSKIAIGSLCMALAVGCRPQLVFGGLLALPIFIRYFAMNSKDERNVKKTVSYILAGTIPYVIIFIPLFYYNAIRFGSPFDFGARYNLTTVDVTRVTANAGKLIPGLFWYLFVPPRITTVFPFIENTAFTSSYSGEFFALYSNGGFMICNPLTFFLLFGFTRKRLFTDIYHKAFFYACLVVAIIILFVDIMMGGFMPRYFCDFTAFVHLACIPVICLMIANADDRLKRNLIPVVTMLCAMTIMYHYFLYYVSESRSFFLKFDREVFLRASLLWQWWE
ncbi:MAG: hypothetical protein Q4A32_07355 [Lachnospiraceae bacterium]|nr:hypothetical protein [Lachnospiraceae bacterium]